MNRFLEFSPLDPVPWSPVYTSDVVSWQPHIPFAFALMKALRPGLFVELGTHKGDSYLAFCEAAQRFGTGTRCRAVDTWKGDAQARVYGEVVLEELRVHHDARYRGFSELIRGTFDEALNEFADGTIDLLHIDGFHNYEAARHDYESWHPKMAPAGLILFHDIEVRRDDFGVYRLWEEISGGVASFSFLHGFGLGVLACSLEGAARLPDLFATSGSVRQQIRSLYRALGYSVAYDQLISALEYEREEAQGEIVRLHSAYNELRTGSDRKIKRLGAAYEELRAGADKEIEALREVSEGQVRQLGQVLQATEVEREEAQREALRLQSAYEDLQSGADREIKRLGAAYEELRVGAAKEIKRLNDAYCRLEIRAAEETKHPQNEVGPEIRTRG